jgi:hypothetical protein
MCHKLNSLYINAMNALLVFTTYEEKLSHKRNFHFTGTVFLIRNRVKSIKLFAVIN